MVKNVKIKEKRILIAEDSLEWQKLHITLMHSYSQIPVNVTMANNAREGLNYIQENLKTPFDLILTDLQMETEFSPDFAGEWLVKQIKNFPEYKNVPIVLISATYNINFIASALGVGALPKRSLINNTNSYNLMLDEHLLK